MLFESPPHSRPGSLLQWTTDVTTSMQYIGASLDHGVLTSAPPTTIAAGSSSVPGGNAESNGMMTGELWDERVREVHGKKLEHRGGGCGVAVQWARIGCQQPLIRAATSTRGRLHSQAPSPQAVASSPPRACPVAQAPRAP